MKKRLLPSILLLAYGAILVKVMVLKDVPMIRIGPVMLNFGGTQVGDPNYIPFKTILPYLLGDREYCVSHPHWFFTAICFCANRLEKIVGSCRFIRHVNRTNASRFTPRYF